MSDLATAPRARSFELERVLDDADLAAVRGALDEHQASS
ncbi:hypothetical protein DB30_06326 [Enhygromyxa salina]|uniref:Uncharacterized protein n=1 Tax=Enhygromyxa salina TaxID=215803 RepID=A0A0C2CYP9_9BACT|nr:hypothetical protein DB30_06326 [Enhygromyxa salina]